MFTRMLKRLQAVIAAMAIGSVALVAMPASATTAPAAPTLVKVVPSPVVVSSDAGTAATFTFSTPDTGSAKLVDPLGHDVPLTVSGGPAFTATYTFTFANEPGPWKLLATATKAGESTTATQEFQVHWITNLDFDATPDLVERGGKVTLFGTLTFKEGSTWKPFGHQKVNIAFKPVGGSSFTRVGWDTTDSHGRFRVEKFADKSGWWRAEFDGSSDTEGTVSDSDRVDVRASAKTTKIVGFDAFPEPVAPGGTLHLRGKLVVGAWSIWDGLKGRQVKIFFKPADGHDWQYVTSDWTDAHGVFFADVTAKASGWWRAVFAGERGLRGSSAVDFVAVTNPAADTRIIKFNAYPEPVKAGSFLYFKGKLQVWDGGWTGYGDQKVTLWFKAHHHWTYVKTIWTNGSGKIWAKTKAVKSGFWKIVFAGNDSAVGSSSRRDWVKVTH
jgi:hypothetical protein